MHAGSELPHRWRIVVTGLFLILLAVILWSALVRG